MKARRILGLAALLIVAVFMLGNTGTGTNGILAMEVTIPTPLTPNGNENDRTPVFTWTEMDGGDLYEIQVMVGGSVVYSSTVATSYCDPHTCTYEIPSLLDYGSYTWQVRVGFSSVWHPWSSEMSFNVIRPILKEPLGAIVTPIPRYVWIKEVGATFYELEILEGTTRLYINGYADSVCGVTNCLVKPSLSLTPGDYKWRVRTQADGVWGAWTAAHNFRVNPDPSFVSDFNTHMDGWKRVRGNWWIASGKVLKTGGVPNSVASVYYLDDNFANMRYQVKMKRPLAGCGTCSTGIIIRGGIQPLGTNDLWNSGYFFAFSNVGKVNVLRIDSGVATLLLPWTDFPAAVNEGNWNILRVDAIGSSLKFYVNNTLVYDGTDSTYTNGKVGIAIYKDGTIGNALLVDWASVSYRNPTSFTALMDGEELVEIPIIMEGDLPLLGP